MWSSLGYGKPKIFSLSQTGCKLFLEHGIIVYKLLILKRKKSHLKSEYVRAITLKGRLSAILFWRLDTLLPANLTSTPRYSRTPFTSLKQKKSGHPFRITVYPSDSKSFAA